MDSTEQTLQCGRGYLHSSPSWRKQEKAEGKREKAQEKRMGDEGWGMKLREKAKG
jgi:hypothetical protein